MPAISFVDTAGERHQLMLTTEQQRELTSLGSQRRQEAQLRDWGYITDPEEAMVEAPTSNADLEAAVADLAALQSRLDAVQQRVTEYATAEQLGSLQSELQRWSAQAARVSISHQEIAATADSAIARCEAISEAAQQRLDQLSADQQAMADAVAAAINDADSRVRGAITDADRRIQSLEQQVATDPAFRGPQGEVGPIGLAGSGVTVAMEDPTKTDPSSWAMRWFGREGLVAGDGALVPTPTALRVFRFTGTSWVEGPAIEPKQELINAKASILDNSTKVYPTVSATAGGGGSGTGGEPLLVNRAALNTGVTLANSSNWAGVSDPTAGQLVIEVVALDGAIQGRRGFACIDFVWQPSGAQDSQAGLLGDLAGVFDLNLTYQRMIASAPAGLAVSIPTSAQALQVFCTIVPTPGGTGTGGVTNFRVSGDLEWAHQSIGQAVPLSSNVGIKPLWRWV
jgi:division protein CdvB (Snf7/Vps24/ESCRT-III family)